MTNALTNVVLAKRTGGALEFTCSAVLVPPAGETTLAGLTAAKTPVVHVTKDAVTLDGKTFDGSSFDASAFSAARALVEIEPDVTFDRAAGVIWALRDAGVADQRFAVKSGKTWTVLPLLQGFGALTGDEAAGSIFIAADAIHVGSTTKQTKLAKGKRAHDFAGLAKQIAVLAKGGATLGVDLAADGAVPWSDVTAAMQVIAKSGFVLAPIVAVDSTIVHFDSGDAQ
jgi:hypothetical protein